MKVELPRFAKGLETMSRITSRLLGRIPGGTGFLGFESGSAVADFVLFRFGREGAGRWQQECCFRHPESPTTHPGGEMG